MINCLVARRFQALSDLKVCTFSYSAGVGFLPDCSGFLPLSKAHWCSLVITDYFHSQKSSLPRVSAVVDVAECVLRKAARLFSCPNSGSVRLSHFSISLILIMSS